METLVIVRGRDGFPVVVRAGFCPDALTNPEMAFCPMTLPDSAQIQAKKCDLASLQAPDFIFMLCKVWRQL